MFSLDRDFVKGFVGRQPKWGPLGYITYKRTYARPLTEGVLYPEHLELAAQHGLKDSEEWWLTLVRVVEGTYRIQEQHCKQLHLPWDAGRAQQSAQEMYRLIWDFKFTPPGRGLWMMGTPVVEKIGSAALNNCGFTSTAEIATNFSAPFCFLMDMSMLGVGVGGDSRGAGKVVIQQPEMGPAHVVEDSREGWVTLVRRVLDSFVGKDTFPLLIDYSQVRPRGTPIKGFGGTASGPEPLQELVGAIELLLAARIGKKITSANIVDLFNLIGRCVVAGNVRRSAEIMFGDPADIEFLDLKDPEKAGQFLASHRWASNNSVFAYVGQDYTACAARTAKNGEPGYLWLDNAQNFSRMGRAPDFKDTDAAGGNPCQPAWATVLTPGGIRTIRDIDTGTLIWSGRRWTRVIRKWSTGVKPVNAYHTRAGTFYGTEHHRVVSAGTKVEAGLAETIDIGMQSKTGLEAAPVYPNVVMDGLVIGDGTVHKASGDLVLLLIGAKDGDYLDSEVAPFLRLHRPGVDATAWEISTSVTVDELPKTYERRVPARYRLGTPLVARSFLRGLYSANGSICGDRVTLKTASIQMVRDVQEMLSSLGIRSYYTTNQAHDVAFSNGTYTCRESYDVNITGDRQEFRRLIGFIQGYKRAKLDAACQTVSTGRVKTTYEVVSVTPLGSEEVFDLTVDDPEHTYWTGGLLVSNCLEQTLESFELCCLVETYPSLHETYKKYQRTLKFAYLYAKTVTLLPTHDTRTNAVLLRNRRIGTSMSGIVQAMNKHGRREFFRWCNEGYEYLTDLDRIYSRWLCVPTSIKKTSVKPSGTVSLLAGVTPGIHFPHSKYYYRVIRFDSASPFIDVLREAGYRCVDLAPGEPNTVAVYFPMKEDFFERGESEVSLWEQLEIAAQVQTYWADNQVSVTVKFDKEREGKDIKNALELYETRLKGVSFLPHEDHGYAHAPYQTITKDEYETAVAALKPYSLTGETHEKTDAFCDGEKCLVPSAGNA
jgi:hypothetical protein